MSYLPEYVCKWRAKFCGDGVVTNTSSIQLMKGEGEGEGNFNFIVLWEHWQME